MTSVKSNMWTNTFNEARGLLKTRARDSKPQNLHDLKKVYSDLVKGNELLLKQIDKAKVVSRPRGFGKFTNLFTRAFQKSRRALDTQKSEILKDLNAYKKATKNVTDKISKIEFYTVASERGNKTLVAMKTFRNHGKLIDSLDTKIKSEKKIKGSYEKKFASIREGVEKYENKLLAAQEKLREVVHATEAAFAPGAPKEAREEAKRLLSKAQNAVHEAKEFADVKTAEGKALIKSLKAEMKDRIADNNQMIHERKVAMKKVVDMGHILKAKGINPKHVTKEAVHDLKEKVKVWDGIVKQLSSV